MKFIVTKLPVENYDFFPELEIPDIRKGEYLDDIFVDEFERNKGVATQEIFQWVNAADKNDQFLFLQACPYQSNKLSSAEYNAARRNLINYYKKFGFLEREDGWMFRPPFDRVDEYSDE